MLLEDRKEVFVSLGFFLSQFTRKGILKKNNIPYNDFFFEAFKTQIKISKESNTWFTEENILFSLENWSYALRRSNIDTWVSSYEFDKNTSKSVAIVMSGNIPLVGFHDFLSVLISGHRVIVKLSSNDKHFIPLIAKYLQKLNPELKKRILFTEEKLKNFDAIIATGSNNTSRYFYYYFQKYPHIIRQNRNTVAILSGEENGKTLEKMSDDIFRYFGLGCRSISKIYLPKGYDLKNIFKAIFKHKDIIEHNCYANNYEYNRAIYSMSLFEFQENGFLILKEDKNYSSPIASLFYEYYENQKSLIKKLKQDSNKIQCITSEIKLPKNMPQSIPLGKTQKPKLWNYADNVDTIDFLLKI